VHPDNLLSNEMTLTSDLDIWHDGVPVAQSVDPLAGTTMIIT